MKTIHGAFASICMIMVLAASLAQAQVPRTISFQGVLSDENGYLLPDGNHQIQLQLYTTAAGGLNIYTETQTVAVVKGTFNAIIGSVTPLPASLAFDRAYFLGVSVDGGSELTPRTALTAVPYAMRAATADVAQSLAPGATGVVTSVNSQSGALTFQGGGGTTVTNNGSSFTISSVGGGGTGIQGVQSTDGSLSITNPNGPVATVGIAQNAITGDKIADGSIGAADIAPGVIPNTANFLANGTTAGGDLAGSYPNPLVADDAITTPKLADNAVTGQILADNAVTGSKIASGQVVKSVNGLADNVTLAAGANVTLTPAGNTITIASSGGGGGTGIQAVQTSNGTLDIQNGSGPVATINVAANAINTAHIAPGAVTAPKLAIGVIPSSLPPNGPAAGDLTGTYPSPLIALNAVTSVKILDGTVASADLGTNAVTTEKITDGNVTAAKLAPGIIPTSLPPSGAAGGALAGTYPNPDLAADAVTSSTILNGTIATTDIADDAVSVAKISPTGATNGQVVTFNGADVVWATPSSGVTGSGIANRLAFWSGTNSLSSDANFSITPGNSAKIALGFQCAASGDNGVAIGAQCTASGVNTVAIGAGSSASTNGGIAMGVSAISTGVRAHAIGNFVTAANGGSCVMGDNNTTTLTSSASNQLSMRFVGGYRLFSNSAFTTGVTMAAGVSGWTNVCDRNVKENFTGVDGEWLLDRIRTLPITEWNYKSADPSIRYIGPMAQDFHEAFHLGGSDSLGINSIIADGVNLAAVQALEKRTRELRETQAALAAKVSELSTLRSEVAELRRLIEQQPVRRASNRMARN